jgi:DnaJ-class molecular chaperone
VEEGTGMTEVTAAFRRYAKEYHPDARGGDRSTEAELRKVVEAYQMIKQHLVE